MKEFSHLIKNEVGIHGRPAVELVKIAKNFPGTSITVTKGEKSVNATRLIMLMGLGAVKDDTVSFCVNGGDEDAAIGALKAFAEKEL